MSPYINLPVSVFTLWKLQQRMRNDSGNRLVKRSLAADPAEYVSESPAEESPGQMKRVLSSCGEPWAAEESLEELKRALGS